MQANTETPADPLSIEAYIKSEYLNPKGAVLFCISIPFFPLVACVSYKKYYAKRQAELAADRAPGAVNISDPLIAQIGDYRTHPKSKNDVAPSQTDDQGIVDSILVGAAKGALYTGTNTQTDNYYREQFIKLIVRIALDDNHARYDGDAGERTTNPKAATISLEDYLGKDGLDLYQKALQEEVNSKEYRNAVFRASTTHFPGKKLGERLVVHVSGPSACGKSYAAEEAVKAACGHSSVKKTKEVTGNHVVAIDNGVGRQVSQMRKLLIRSANNRGFSGLSDLDKQSNETLQPMKKRLQKAALATEGLHLVIPDTYSTFDPLGIGIGIGKGRIKTIDALEGTKQVFCRVDGEDPLKFKNVVGYMGAERAWKTTFAAGGSPLDMNSTENLTESKAYHGKHFESGRSGSQKAQEWFETESKEGNLSVLITNDLMLLKVDPHDPLNWVRADTISEGQKKISARVYEQWIDSDQPRDTLDDFATANPVGALIGPPTVVGQSQRIFLMEQGSKLGFTDRMCKEWEVASLMGNTPDVPNKAADTARVIMDTRATDVAVAAKEGGMLLSTKKCQKGGVLILKRTATGTASDISRGELDDILTLRTGSLASHVF